MFELEKYNGGPSKPSDLGFVLKRLAPTTLSNLRDDYGHNRWLHLRTLVGIGAWVKQLPPDMDLLPDDEDGLPIQITAIRTDGKKWNLNLPIRFELLRQMRHYFSERDYVRLLRIGRTSLRRMRTYMKREQFTLQLFTSDVLERIVRGKKRGRKKEP